jgi:uncharacterized protein (DUF488 family)
MLFTLGYEGLNVDTYIAALKLHDIHTLVDVRELPLSRKKGFSKNVLAARLDAEGIGYLHLRSLGAPRPIRHALRADGD